MAPISSEFSVWIVIDRARCCVRYHLLLHSKLQHSDFHLPYQLRPLDADKLDNAIKSDSTLTKRVQQHK